MQNLKSVLQLKKKKKKDKEEKGGKGFFTFQKLPKIFFQHLHYLFRQLLW